MKDAKEVLDGVQKGNARALARLISWAENREPQAEEVLAKLFSKIGHARILGITGPPGAGKSTLVAHFIRYCRAKNLKVAVIAVDPVSPFSGGALLGDRIRLTEHFNDPDVFIRSLSTRGQLGGLSLATREVVHAVDAAGFDVIVLETVGVGQSEVEVRKIADATLVVLSPDWGDGIQAIKAGILEIADLFAIHKADREGADRVAAELRQALQDHAEPPEILISKESDPKSLTALFDAWWSYFDRHAGKMKSRREQGIKDTLMELVERRVLEEARKKAASQTAQVSNPYEGYLKLFPK